MKVRLISAAVGIILLCVVLLLRDVPFVLRGALAVLSAVAVYEMLAAQKLKEHRELVWISVLGAAVICLIPTELFKTYSAVLLFVYLILLFLIMMRKRESLGIEQIAIDFMMTLLIPLGFLPLALINELRTFEPFSALTSGDTLFLLFLSLGGAWMAYSGSYFSGRLFGKHKLAPVISPKKTIEGLIGGVVCNMLIFALIGLIYTRIDSTVSVNYLQMMILGGMAALLGCAGDLTASAIKRKANIKDYGNLMPGHGGVLDRFDSILFVAPAMYLLVRYLWHFWPLIIR